MDATKKHWRDIFKDDLIEITPLVERLGFSLDDSQTHLSGERFLMTRNKLVLSGKKLSDDTPVIIKVAKHPEGRKEIEKEKRARDTLLSVAFSKESLLFPTEILYQHHKEWVLLVTEYIPQKKVFVEHTLEDQFFMALRSFETQEAFHATTFEHLKYLKDVFPIRYARDYLSAYNSLLSSLKDSGADSEIIKTVDKGYALLGDNKRIIDEFCNHLIHTDFVPHNFRIREKSILILDCAAIEFGNKYEGWARFLNYMVIHNNSLNLLLLQYLKDNRTDSDLFNLTLMRIYKIVYLLDYYHRSLQKTSGDLHTLTKIRIEFWHTILVSLLENTEIHESFIEEYRQKRNSLRSPEEQERQKEFALA